MKNDGNKGVKTAQRDVKENKIGDLSQQSIVNRSPHKTRDGNHQISNVQKALLPMKHSKGPNNPVEIVGGTIEEMSAKNKPNGIVTLMGTNYVYAGSGDVSKDISGNGQCDNVHMKVLGDAGWSHNQVAQGKVTEFNGTTVLHWQLQ